jgi:glycine cleavage system pyridoxal-binding protein P
LRQISWQALTDLEVANVSVLSSSIASAPAVRYLNLQQAQKNRKNENLINGNLLFLFVLYTLVRDRNSPGSSVDLCI